VVTDVDPGDVPHVEAVIGGSPDDIGGPPEWGGVAPYACQVIPDAVIYVFAELWNDSAPDVCHAAAQEIAHTLGLDHEVLCSDPMTYLDSCGDKAFQDVDAPCGERDARDCACGGATQNSVEVLTRVLGHRGDPIAAAPPASTDAGGCSASPGAGLVPVGFALGLARLLRRRRRA
jgi:uncharacterized protein (TIGR03382 family)